MFLIFFDLTLLTSNSAVKKCRWRYSEKYNVPQIIFSWIDPQTIHRNYFPNMFNAIGTANKRFPMGFRYGTDMIEVLINKVTIWNIECIVLVSPVFNTQRSPFFFYQCKGNETLQRFVCFVAPESRYQILIHLALVCCLTAKASLMRISSMRCILLICIT